ncbi:hypothetical protein [Streptomyces puniciscabiei]|nr:hypothetical protein [Streptomyces puniciscabiei]
MSLTTPAGQHAFPYRRNPEVSSTQGPNPTESPKMYVSVQT